MAPCAYLCLRVGAAAGDRRRPRCRLRRSDHPDRDRSTPNIAGMIVFLDPGHNGANDASISRQVPTGRGGTKDCQTSGTSTDDGYPEHTFNWDTVLRIRAGADRAGRADRHVPRQRQRARPVRRRTGRDGQRVAPERHRLHPRRRRPGDRARFPRQLLVAAAQRAQAGPSVQFARIMRDQLQASGMPPANYIGQDGLYGRSDLTGLNLAQYPSILIEWAT